MCSRKRFHRAVAATNQKMPCALLSLRLQWNLAIMPFDTSPEAAAIQEEFFRRMTTAQRLRLALEMSESLRNVTLAGLRSRQPRLNTNELSRELIRIMYGFAPQP